MLSMTQRGEKLPELVAIMQKLLAADGCPWDREQTLETLRPYVVEEAHEVVDAIDRKDMQDLREELGDLLLQIVFQTQLTKQHFGIDDVVDGIVQKLVRRHPHVFGDEAARDAGHVKELWEKLKAEEKKERGVRGVLDGVPVTMPALLRALRVGEKAAHLGLDWPDAHGPRQKVNEELAELDQAIASGERDAIEAELGDALFSLVSVARKHAVDPEAALRRTIEGFGARVRWIERHARENELDPAKLPPDDLDALWQRAKEAVRE
jgi:MazG family protein